MSNPTILLGELVDAKLNFINADFWVVCSGTDDDIGEVTYEFHPKHIGIKVTKPEAIYPRYLYYVMQYMHMSHYWLKFIHNHHISVTDIKSIRLQQE